MKTAFYTLAALLFICFAGLAVSAVLIDHGHAPRLAYDLFAVAGVIVGIPALLFAIFND